MANLRPFDAKPLDPGLLQVKLVLISAGVMPKKETGVQLRATFHFGEARPSKRQALRRVPQPRKFQVTQSRLAHAARISRKNRCQCNPEVVPRRCADGSDRGSHPWLQ